jgi:hypothetical protein
VEEEEGSRRNVWEEKERKMAWAVEEEEELKHNIEMEKRPQKGWEKEKEMLMLKKRRLA